MASFTNGILFYHDSAGQGEVTETIGEVTKNLVKMCQSLTIYKSEEKGDIIDYCHKIKEEQLPFDVIYLLGGDGTVHELINGVIAAELNLPIGILPGGTFNDFTKTLNLPPEPVAASQALLEASVKHIDVMKVNDRYVLNFVGLGLIVENSEGVAEDAKSRIGKFSYLMSTLKNVTNPTFFDYKVTVDGKLITGSSSMIITANGQFVGGNRIPLTELAADDGILNVFIFKESGIKLFTELLSEKSTDNWNELSNNIEHYSGCQITIETAETMAVDVDGEIDIETPLQIDMLTKRLRMFTGNKTF
ncbi:diacylglycerol/lipid kinase family protein [Macrococcus equipercicus]|uniref:Diacylglycerol kinase family lipid kinase n=1 Tax=Macrococcus equipercicus TaxID=69967 RepID=A0A9Q9BND4_9STAP|nr:diacylglycerol kinase family protein [Macrococcus equipercicus]KAA1042429.1 diacylglycerol kinase family lipid kinase [Macrococcus equipercicus]UTH14315.1 diacylglycerol kinase family lipid kinase [Macrococcus equipercicus]